MSRSFAWTSGRYATAVALGYGVLAGLYILISSQWAADAARSVDEMARIETIKGISFVVVTAMGVFGGAYWAMRRIERDAEELRRRERALVTADGRVFAGLMASSVAHDANNVLVAVLAEVDELAAGALPRQAETAKRLSRSVERLVQLNRRLMSASQQGLTRDRQPIDLVLAARECVNDLRSHRAVRNCHVVVRAEGELVIMGNPLLAQQVFANLVINAAEATGGHGTVELRVERRADEFAIEVHDDGPGVPLERRATLFDSLQTTKSDGHGLGLFSVRACAECVGGRVEVDTSPLGGALFRVLLPSQHQLAAV